jgi:cell division protein FtsI (penicillin-binding protein 3)
MEKLNVGNLSLSASRIRALLIFIFICFLLFTLRLIQIQAIQASEYRNKAANEMESTRAIPAARGEITDINGIDFARSVSAINIVVDQTLITNASQTANFAAPYLGMTVAQVQSAISGTKRYAMVVKSAKPAVWRDLNIAVDRYNASLIRKTLISESLDSLLSEISFVNIHQVHWFLPLLDLFVKMELAQQVLNRA